MMPTNTVGLPDRRTPASMTEAEGPETERAPAAPLLLVVEDDQQAKEGLTEFLLSHGYRVSDAKDGAEALLKVEAYRPDMILLDLALPRMDGWSVARQLKSDDRFRDVPVIAMSALDYPDEVERARESGCDAFLPKPVDLRRLLPLVEEAIKPRWSPRGTS
jgi:two-component system, cell cycle response regulator DivK